MRNSIYLLIGIVIGWFTFVLMSFTYVRNGQSSYGTINYTIDGEYIREGQSSYGKILYNIDGNYIREGQSSYGKILYNITRN